MRKQIDMKSRIVHMYDADLGRDQDEIIGYLDRKMKVRFHSVNTGSPSVVFVGKPTDGANNSLTVSGYRRKTSSDKYSIEIG